MKTDIWMPLYTKDYLGDTSRLSTIEHGAYLLMLMDYWVNGPLPNDIDVLLQVTKLPKDKQNIITKIIRSYFLINENGMLINKRLEQEITTAQNQKAVKSRAGKLGGGNPNFKKGLPNVYYEKKDKQEDNQKHKQEDNQINKQTHKQKINPSPSPSPSPSPIPSPPPVVIGGAMSLTTQIPEQPKISNGFDFYLKNINPMITAFERDQVIDLMETYSEDWFIQACQIAVKNEARKLSYIEAVLKKSKNRGFINSATSEEQENSKRETLRKRIKNIEQNGEVLC